MDSNQTSHSPILPPLVSEQLVQKLFVAAADSMFVVNDQGAFVAANAPACTLSGYTQAALLPLSLSDLFLTEGSAARPLHNHDLPREKAVLRERNGRTRPVTIETSPLDDGRLLLTVHPADGHTAASSQARYLRYILDTIPDYVWLKDPDGVYLAGNPMFERFMGAAEAEFVGKTDAELFEPERAEQFRQWDQRAILAGKPVVNEEWVSSVEDGRLHLMETIKTPLVGDDGQLVGVLGIARDITAREQAETAVKKLAKFPDENPNPIMRIAQDGILLYANQASADLLANWACAIGRRLPDTWHRHVQDTLASGMNKEVETAVAGRIFSLSLVPLADDGYVNIYGYDITRRKQAQKEVQESQNRLAGILDTAMDAIVTVDEAQRIVLFNAAAEQMFGCTAAEVIGQHHDILLPERFRGVHQQYVGHFARTGETKRKMDPKTTLFGLRANGEEFPVEISISEAEADGQRLYTAILRDVTARRQTRAELDELRDILAAAESVAKIGSWKWDFATQKVTWSDEMYHLFEVDRASFDGELTTVINDRIHPDDVEAVNQSNLSTLEQLKPIPLEYRVVLPSGSERVVWAEGRLIHDKDSGAPIALVGYVQDITERKRIEAAQARLEEQLRQAQKMESIGRLAGGVAHDFNNQLTVIQLYSDWVRSSMAKDNPLLPKVAQICQAAEHAAELTRQLLAFSRRQVLQPVTLNLNDLVANLQKMLGRLIGEDINFSTNLEPGLWPVQADRGQIEQVIMNLVVNARDAMPTGGLLTIETSNEVLDELIKTTHLDAPLGPCVMLSVTDTGQGMDAATQKQIFEPFFTTKAPGKGTGLGLATVHGTVKQSGGAIYVYSEPGQGTSFKIYLPAGERSGGPLADSSLVTMIPQGHETILLVEDEAALRDLVRATLQDMGYTVLEAGDGRAALELVEQQTTPIDLLLTDVVMPQMSGRDLAQLLTARWPALKVLFMSGYMDDKVVRHELSTAQVNFLAKPFTRSVLASKVRAVLDKA